MKWYQVVMKSEAGEIVVFQNESYDRTVAMRMSLSEADAGRNVQFYTRVPTPVQVATTMEVK